MVGIPGLCGILRIIRVHITSGISEMSGILGVIRIPGMSGIPVEMIGK